MAESKRQGKHHKFSLIKKYFSKEVLIELYKNTLRSCDNNQKCLIARSILQEHGIPFEGLGAGTNRYAINMRANSGMVAVKIALDSDGMIDNRREFLYGKELYPDVCKVYECLPERMHCRIFFQKNRIRIWTVQIFHVRDDHFPPHKILFHKGTVQTHHTF